MKTQNEKNSGIIVAFQIGRGGRFYNPGHRTFIGEKEIGEFTNDLFLMDGANEYTDCNGNTVGLTVDEEKTGIGRINIDNEYDTTYTCLIEDCDEKEIEIIKESNEYKSHELLDYLEKLQEVY